MAPAVTAVTVASCAATATALSAAFAAWGENIAKCIEYLRALGKQRCPVCGSLLKHSKFLKHLKLCKRELAEILKEERQRIEDMMEAECAICKATMKLKDLAQHVNLHAAESVGQRARVEKENEVGIKDRKSKNRRNKNRRF